MKTEKDSSKLDIIKNAEKVTEEAILSIKEICTNLSPHILKNYGLISAIKKFTDKVSEPGILNIDFQTNVKSFRLQNNVEVVVYRAVCELINNTVKHSGARNVSINLSYNISNKVLDIFYDDDGQGCKISEILEGETLGMGLQNIQSRISTLDGFINFESKLDNGFHAYISVNTDLIDNNV